MSKLYDLLYTIIGKTNKSLRTEVQVLTEDQKVQARANIGAMAASYTPPNQTAQQVGADPVGTASSLVSGHNTNGEAHSDIRSLVNNLSTDCSRFDTRITNLENKALSFVTDSSVAYTKDVPEKALPYAAISKIGGLSKKSNNELKIESYYAGTSNGVTATYNATDGTVTLNGTSTGQAIFYFQTNYAIPTGSYYYKTNGSGMGWNSYYGSVYNADTGSTQYDTGSGASFTSNGNRFQFQITIMSGRTFNNVVLKPMVNVGNSALPFEPYFTGVRNAKITEVISSLGGRISIPESVQSLDGYGQSNPDNPEEYNYIDFEKFYSSGHIVDGAWVAYESVQETDISDLITDDGSIRVEGGGTLTFVNEFGYAVPSEVYYQLEGVEV